MFDSIKRHFKKYKSDYLMMLFICILLLLCYQLFVNTQQSTQLQDELYKKNDTITYNNKVIDSLQQINDSLMTQIDSSKQIIYKTIIKYELQKDNVDHISIDSNLVFFSNYLSQYSED